jgi:hypothetical protein
MNMDNYPQVIIA